MGKIDKSLKIKSTVYPDKPARDFTEWHENLLQRAEPQRLKYEPRIDDEMKICEDLANTNPKKDEEQEST
tara:strand:+ start:5252 stop:5461 length:210 start_codon:yes stop_codon:yes gene_type:complete